MQSLVQDSQEKDRIPCGARPVHSAPPAGEQPEPNGQQADYRYRLLSFLNERRAPALLVSVILHTALLLFLALCSIGGGRLDGLVDEALLAAFNEPNNRQLVQLLASGDAPPPPSDNPSLSSEPPAEASETSLSLSDLLKPDAPRSTANRAEGEIEQLFNSASMSLTASFSATGIEGRNPKKRRQTALARGGTLQSEQAVERALEWLAEHQRPNGSWSLLHAQGSCNGRCRNEGSKDRFDTAATGLSLLAFLGAGYTHRDGVHRETVRRGIYFLLQVIEETPQGGSFLYQSDRGMYNHGIAAFALCEAYQLTADQDLLKPAQQAIDFIVTAQNYRGGWGYLPEKPGDLTISGWQLMALKSAYAAQLEIPPMTILRTDHFLDSQQHESGIYFGYGKPGESPTCTAIGQLIRLFRGRSHSDPTILDAADFFTRRGLSTSDVYYNYYASLFLFHVGSPFWDRWNPALREHLVATQSKSGHEAGSWFFDNAYGREGGRLYTTAMCAMTLEVYYRFSPLYQQTDVSFEL